MPDFKLPDLGEGVTEAEVDRWLVKEGDEIAEDEPLVEVITDKATAEIPSPYAGVVARIHVPEGDIAAVGTVLVTIGAEAAVEPAPKSADVQPATPRPIRAMPPVRKLARELGVDLAAIEGSGPGGSITRADVERRAGASTPMRVSPSPVKARAEDARELEREAGERREPLRGVRRTIAQRMTVAHRVVPPVTHVEECDVTELDETRKLINERSPSAPKLTFLPFIVRAVVEGLRSYPALNSSLDEEAAEIVYHSRFDIGVAVDTDAGLSVPVVHAADAKSIRELANEIEQLALAARAGTLELDDLRGATFTITSPGPWGGLMATPIVFHPQAAILGVHKATERPVVRSGQIVIRKMMNLSVTFDHRILDGLTAAKFTMEVARLLEHPALLTL
jgi:pyruvate/2-oxoglutarate dehydrogenase complex dihydrolipoamide acyltransferase (E2) component